ncbi:nucleotidyltransferase domain-containing protein [Candidatus Peregrinibacteria bacterium]|nr:nucleotidyltransferase domain-containing protein [Candidatus Peregrinibacteria bacterium]
MIKLNSKITERLLTYFFVNKDEEKYINELAKVLKLDPKNLDKKLKELETLGLFKSRFLGKQRYYSLNKNFPLLHEFEQIIKKTTGLPLQIEKALQNIKGIETAYIFGSYALNKMNISSDIDLLVAGHHNVFDVQKAILPVQNFLGREINIVDLTPEEFNKRLKNKDPFLSDVFSRPMIKIL